MTVLEVRGLGKSFRRYHNEWLRVATWFGLPTQPRDENWVLRNVSFAAVRGESLGIVGVNGAGKSTLLKLIAGTLHPSRGDIHAKGSIAAILGLGVSFNLELSGRQNAVHALGLMGFSPASIRELTFDVENFADLGEYFTLPVRIYSDGMRMRLAFSVATASRPDILIVDEALSVGDASFQHKCYSRIRRFLSEGTTLLLVSHDRNAILTVCSRALLLHEGSIIEDGRPDSVLDVYNAVLADKRMGTVRTRRMSDGGIQTRSGSGEALIESVDLYDDNGTRTDVITAGCQVELRVNVQVMADIDELVLGFLIKDPIGRTVYGFNTWHYGQQLRRLSSGNKIMYVVRFAANLGSGSYSMTAALHASESHVGFNYDWWDLALMFEVVNAAAPWSIGPVLLDPRISVVMDAPETRQANVRQA